MLGIRRKNARHKKKKMLQIKRKKNYKTNVNPMEYRVS